MSALTLATALACALASGALFAFSAFVMGALARLAPEPGIRAMPSINVRAVTPAYMTALFAPALAAMAVAVLDGEPLAIAGAALYLLGTLGITIAGNVPLNDALAGLDPASGAAQWRDYVRRSTTRACSRGSPPRVCWPRAPSSRSPGRSSGRGRRAPRAAPSPPDARAP